jgi:hypothetical protein
VDDRNFEVTSEITGEWFTVVFCWLQTAIALRRTDTVDVKFLVNGQGKVVALPHGAVERACRQAGIPLTDPLCRRLAAQHLETALGTGEDADKDLITVLPEQVPALVQACCSSSWGSVDKGSRSSASNTFLQSRHST